jgi:hypothetical protein
MRGVVYTDIVITGLDCILNSVNENGSYKEEKNNNVEVEITCVIY